MTAQSKSRLIFSAALVLVLLKASCGKAKSLMVVENGQATVLMLSLDEEGMSEPWAPGTVVLFRATETVKSQHFLEPPKGRTPVGEMGKAGEVYVVTDDYKLS